MSEFDRQGDPKSKICRWCRMPRRIHKGALWCPECDERGDLRGEQEGGTP